MLCSNSAPRQQVGPGLASWMETRSWSFILSNSSMRQTPLSASTSAPPSSVHSRVTGSFCTAAVSPTALAPLPALNHRAALMPMRSLSMLTSTTS